VLNFPKAGKLCCRVERYSEHQLQREVLVTLRAIYLVSAQKYSETNDATRAGIIDQKREKTPRGGKEFRRNGKAVLTKSPFLRALAACVRQTGAVFIQPHYWSMFLQGVQRTPGEKKAKAKADLTRRAERIT
jgi:hypothetical protein